MPNTDNNPPRDRAFLRRAFTDLRFKIGKLCVAFIKKHYKTLPIDRKKIVFVNFGGKGYGENPKYIAEEFLRRDDRYKLVWLVRDAGAQLPEGIRPVRWGSVRSYYDFATAKAWVLNTRNHKLTEKRKDQVYLQTWHGSIAYKKVEEDAEEKLPEPYVIAAKEDGALVDGIIADGKFYEDVYKRAFWLNPDCEILRTGSPRLDPLLKNNGCAELTASVRSTLGADPDSCLVLYAPTFRLGNTQSGYITDFADIREAFVRRFGKTEIAVRLHPNAEGMFEQLYGNDRSVINATKYPDAQELAAAADCLITDYSSIAYDFVLLRKPVFLCTKDLDEYLKDRGVYDFFYQQPFRLNQSEKELTDEILCFSENDYRKKVDDFFDRNPTYNRGDASVQAVDWLLSRFGQKTSKA